MTTRQKAYELKARHGINCPTQVEQILALVPFYDTENRIYWENVHRIITTEFDLTKDEYVP